MNELDTAAAPIADWIRFCSHFSSVFRESPDPESFQSAIFPQLLSDAGCTSAVLATQSAGDWAVSALMDRGSDAVRRPSDAAISRSADQDSVIQDQSWTLIPVPMTPTISTQRVLAVQFPGGGDPWAMAAAAELLASALAWVESESTHRRRAMGLASILSAAARWQSHDDTDELLQAIAETTTKTLECERATIFLWDRRVGKLIGRPAMGIDGDELVVSDSAGVVGEVLQSAESKLWSLGADSSGRLNQTVDQQTGFQTESLAAVAMRDPSDKLIGVFEAINQSSGAFDALDLELLESLAQHAAAAIQSQGRRQRLKRSRDRLVDDAAATSPLIGDHGSIRELRTQSAKVARTELSVLILGRNGTGKEVLARQVHYQSDRRSGPFVAVNCAALVETLLESELFGHEKGAFTDAQSTRIGKFELAAGGTLFLDEIGDMSLGGQAKLLRVLEEKVIVRVGGSETIPVDVRVVAATNQPLEELIQAKRFREDLYFRLSVVSLRLPPLAERGGDVLVLANHFLDHFAAQIGRPVLQFSEESQLALQAHPWPGNVRQLRNTIERASYLSETNVITPADLDLPASVTSGPSGGAETGPIHAAHPKLTDATRLFQIRHIEATVASAGGNMTEAASRMGLHRSNLYRKMRQLGMSGASDEGDRPLEGS